MSNNPYNAPGPMMPGQPAGDPAYAADRVKVPAIGLMVAMGIGIAFTILGLVQNALGIAGIGPGFQPPDMDPEAMQQFRGIQIFSGGLGILFGVIGLIVGVVVILGAIKMKNLENYTFAMTASILSLIPCISPCCLLGLVFGIWGIVVLNDPQVKAAFRG